MSTHPLSQPVSNHTQAVAGVKLGHFIVSMIATILTIFGGWVTAQKAIERNSTRIEQQEKKVDRIEDKLDIIINKINAVDVKLESKQDRPR
jgi:hypothetical protein